MWKENTKKLFFLLKTSCTVDGYILHSVAMTLRVNQMWITDSGMVTKPLTETKYRPIHVPYRRSIRPSISPK